VRVALAGRGRVTAQTPAAGEPLGDDAVVQLTLAVTSPRAGAPVQLAAAGGAR
jgi:hypothetical protein